MTVFADSYYYLALINAKDEGHEEAIDFARTYRGRTVTTEWVLAEVGDALAQPNRRSAFRNLLESIRRDSLVTVVQANHLQFEDGVALFNDRADKEWSLTDCISLLAMEQFGIRDALTADKHFVQAGYNALLI